jgi:hypothetical protein
VKAAASNVPSSLQEFGDAVFTDELSVLEQLKLDYPTFGKPLPPAVVI